MYRHAGCGTQPPSDAADRSTLDHAPATGRHSAPGSITGFREFDGRDHLAIVEPGWEQVADYVLAWLDPVAHVEAAGE